MANLRPSSLKTEVVSAETSKTKVDEKTSKVKVKDSKEFMSVEDSKTAINNLKSEDDNFPVKLESILNQIGDKSATNRLHSVTKTRPQMIPKTRKLPKHH